MIKTSSVAVTLKVLGWLNVVVGLIFSFFLVDEFRAPSLMLVGLAMGIIGCVVLYGAAIVVQAASTYLDNQKMSVDHKPSQTQETAEQRASDRFEKGGHYIVGNIGECEYRGVFNKCYYFYPVEPDKVVENPYLVNGSDGQCYAIPYFRINTISIKKA